MEIDIDVTLAIVALLFGKGLLTRAVAWLRKRMSSKHLSANDTTVVPSDFRIALPPKGKVTIEISTHTDEVTEPPTSSESSDD